MNVISIDELRKNKLNSNRIKKVTGDTEKPTETAESSLTNAAYYFSIDSVDVNFGGAFVRSLIQGLKENKDKVLKTIKMSNESSRERLDITLDKNDYRYELLKKSLSEQEKAIESIVNGLKTPNDLDAMFEEGSQYLSIIGYVLTIIMAHSYSEFDYHRMERDKWLQLSTSIEDLINLPVYKEFKLSGI